MNRKVKSLVENIASNHLHLRKTHSLFLCFFDDREERKGYEVYIIGIDTTIWSDVGTNICSESYNFQQTNERFRVPNIMSFRRTCSIFRPIVRKWSGCFVKDGRFDRIVLFVANFSAREHCGGNWHGGHGERHHNLKDENSDWNKKECFKY